MSLTHRWARTKHVCRLPVTLAALIVLAIAPPLVANEADALQRLVRRLVVENAPRVYEKQDSWGQKTEIVSGLDVRREGLQIRTHRRRKLVNHGTWKSYTVRLADPAKDLDVQIKRRENAADGALRFDITLTARVHALGRLQQWKSGVQLASVSVEADVRLRMSMRCQLGVEMQFSRFPPDVLLRPRVERADLALLEFNVRRISKLRGDLAEELGRALRGVVERKLEESEPRLVAKMNAKLAEHRDDLRLSLADWAAAKWNELSGE